MVDRHSLLPETCGHLFRTPLAVAGVLLPINVLLFTNPFHCTYSRLTIDVVRASFWQVMAHSEGISVGGAHMGILAMCAMYHVGVPAQH